MRISKFKILTSVMLFSFTAASVPLGAQTVLPAAGLSLPLYNTEGSARSAAMGSALVGFGGDAAALLWNPAGLAGLDRMDLSLHHNSYFAGVFQETLVFGLPLSPQDGLAISADYVNWGSFDERDSTGALLGSFTDTDTGLGVGWGREWFRGFSAGFSLRGLQQKVKENNYNSLVGNLGVLWTPSPGWQAGMVYTNLGNSLAGSGNASDLKVGLTWKTKAARDLVAFAALAGAWEPQGVSSLQGGLEGTWRKSLALRIGYRLDLSDNQLSGLAGLTAGAGLNLGDFAFDYAFLPSGDLGTAHRISLSYEFPKPVPPVPVTIVATAVPTAPAALPTPAPVPAGSSLDLRFKLPEEAGVNPTGQPAQEDLTPLITAVQQAPDDAQAWWNLGMAYYHKGQKQNAVQCFEQVLRLKPDNPKLKAWLENYEGAKP